MNLFDFFIFLQFFKIFFLSSPVFTLRARIIIAQRPELQAVIASIGGFDNLFLYSIPTSITLCLIQLQIYFFIYWAYINDYLNVILLPKRTRMYCELVF
jgi:hypothetical protein